VEVPDQSHDLVKAFSPGRTHEIIGHLLSLSKDLEVVAEIWTSC
jgi:hypothetical protein